VTSSRPHRIRILGLPLDDVTLAEAVHLAQSWCTAADTLQQIVTLNPEMVMAARRNADFRAVV